MSAADLAFSLDEGHEDRAALLTEAADWLDARKHELGGEPAEAGAPTAEAALLRDLVQDVARFAGLPVVHEIGSPSQEAQRLQAPVAVQGLAGRSRLVSLYLPLVLQPRRAWGYNRLDLGVSLDPDGDAGRRAKAVEILPNRRVRTLVEVSGEVELRLGATAGAEAGIPRVSFEAVGVPVAAEANVDAHAAARVGVLGQPFRYRLQKVEIEHTDIGAEEVYWRLSDGEFGEGAVPAFVVLAQLPDGADGLRVSAAMRVYRNFTGAGGGMIEAIRSLPAALKTFLTRGAPIEVMGTWDLTPHLGGSGTDGH